MWKSGIKPCIKMIYNLSVKKRINNLKNYFILSTGLQVKTNYLQLSFKLQKIVNKTNFEKLENPVYYVYSIL